MVKNQAQINSIMAKNNSIYSASFTAAGMMYSETIVVAQMLLKDNSAMTKTLLRDDAQYLKIQSSSARDRVLSELFKRYDSMPASFWTEFLTLPEDEQRLALFFVLLKTYRLIFHFQIELALPKYNSIDRVLDNNSVLMCLSEIASSDQFVDSWTEKTRKKIASTYITMLKQAGLIDKTTNELIPPAVSDDVLAKYVSSGNVWFLQACFIPQYKIEQLKQRTI